MTDLLNRTRDPLDPRKKLFDAMAASIDRPLETKQIVNPNINLRMNPNLPQPIETSAPPSGLPNAVASPSKPASIRIHIGADTGGLQGVDRSLAELRTQEQAVKDYPSSKVVNGEVLPPKMHHGLGDKLKSLGKGLVISMGEYARTHPGAEAGELLGAGGAGATVGAVSPVSIDALQRQAEIAQKRQEVGSQIGLEQEQAQTQAMKQGPQHNPVYGDRVDEQGNVIRQKYNPKTGKMEDDLGPDSQPVIIKRPAARTEKEPLFKVVDKRDGSKVTKRSDDNGKTWVEVPDLASEAPAEKPDKAALPPEVIDRNIAGIREQQAKIDAFLDKPENQYVEVPNGEPYYDKEGKVVTPTKRVVNPEWEKAKDDRNRLDAEIRDWEGKRKTTPASTSAPSPSTHVLSKKDWLKSHDAKDWPKATAEAKRLGYSIVE